MDNLDYAINITNFLVRQYSGYKIYNIEYIESAEYTKAIATLIKNDDELAVCFEVSNDDIDKIKLFNMHFEKVKENKYKVRLNETNT